MPNDTSTSSAAGATPATGATPGNTGTTSTPAAPGATPAAGATPSQDNLNFDTWLAGQPEQIRSLITGRFTTLEGTLDSERTQRKDLAKQLKDLSGKLDANSEAGKQAAKLSADLEAASARADFYEALGPGCTNPKLAWLAYQADGLKSIDQLRTAYPQLFAAAKPAPSNAGNGTGQQPGTEASMNDWIRQAAGVKK
jgi:hypothetical protein